MFFPPPFECRGRTLPLSVPRKFLADFTHFARNTPLVAITRRMNLAPLVEARKAMPRPVNWTVLFAKAFAVVAAGRPELRRAYMTWPWHHLYENSDSVASLAVEREYAGEPMILFGLFRSPETTPLRTLADELHRFKTAPLETVEPLYRTVRITKLPKVARRLLWVHALYQSGRIKAQNFGTFGVSSVAPLGVSTSAMASPLTSTLSLGPFDQSGALDVRLDFDHRVYDGLPAARALAGVERVLLTDLLAEVRSPA
jgi:hypothetical protein